MAVGNWSDCIGGQQQKRQLSPASDDQFASTHSPRDHHINNSQVPGTRDVLINPVQQVQQHSRPHHGIDPGHRSPISQQHQGPKVIVSTEPWWKRSTASSSDSSGKWFFPIFFLNSLFPFLCKNSLSIIATISLYVP